MILNSPIDRLLSIVNSFFNYFYYFHIQVVTVGVQ